MKTHPYCQEKRHMGALLHCGKSHLTIVSPLEDIDSDRIVGIQCDFPGYDTLYILGVYLPSSSLNTKAYDEYFDYMWALYESLFLGGWY